MDANDLIDYRKTALEMLALFAEKIGFNGDEFKNRPQSAIAWYHGKDHSKFFSPEPAIIDPILAEGNYDNSTVTLAKSKGLILVKDNYEDLSDLYISIIHETLHSYRNVYLYDVFRKSDNMYRNESAYTYNGELFEQNTSEYSSHYVDFSQDVLKGKIDNSPDTIAKYNGKTDDEIVDSESDNGVGHQMIVQQAADEGLVELISLLANNLYNAQQKNKDIDIFDLIELISDEYQDDYVGSMCQIVLKHHDLELFKWMLDPIKYCKNDFHYDFFGAYTQKDQDLVDELVMNYEDSLDELVVDKYYADDQKNSNTDYDEISMLDMQETAETEEAMDELPPAMRFLQNLLDKNKVKGDNN